MRKRAVYGVFSGLFGISIAKNPPLRYGGFLYSSFRTIRLLFMWALLHPVKWRLTLLSGTPHSLYALDSQTAQNCQHHVDQNLHRISGHRAPVHVGIRLVICVPVVLIVLASLDTLLS